MIISVFCFAYSIRHQSRTGGNGGFVPQKNDGDRSFKSPPFLLNINQLK